MLLKEDKLSIRSLRYLSPVVNLAVIANGCDRDLDHIALPPGDEQAYQAILVWLGRIHFQQRVVPLHVTGTSKLIAHHNILEIAEKLRIGPLISQMRGKLFSKLDYTAGDMYRVYSDDANYTRQVVAARTGPSARRLPQVFIGPGSPQIYQNTKGSISPGWLTSLKSFGKRCCRVVSLVEA